MQVLKDPPLCSSTVAFDIQMDHNHKKYNTGYCHSGQFRPEKVKKGLSLQSMYINFGLQNHEINEIFKQFL